MNAPSSLSPTAESRFPYASLLLVAFVVLLSSLPGVASHLQYDRRALADGEMWRLMTSHFVHWSSNHLFWDAFALGMLGWLCERQNRRRFLLCVVGSAVLISICLWFTEPRTETYRGLSGIDSALFAMLAVSVLQNAASDRDWLKFALAGIVSAGFVAKVGWELVTGNTLFVDSSAAGMTPVPLAHLIGGIAGMGCVLRDNAASRARKAGKEGATQL